MLTSLCPHLSCSLVRTVMDVKCDFVSVLTNISHSSKELWPKQAKIFLYKSTRKTVQSGILECDLYMKMDTDI